MLCRVCGRMNREDDLFCGSCGQKLQRVRICRICGGKSRSDSLFCAACGMALSEDPTTCGHCGHPLTPRDHFCGHCGTQAIAGQRCDHCHTFNHSEARYCVSCGEALPAHVPTA